MPPVCTAHGGNPRCVTRGRKPVVNCGSDFAAVDGRLSGAVVPGNEQHDPVAASNGMLQDAVDRAPRLVEIVTVEVEDAIGIDFARLEIAVPTAIQRQPRRGSRRRGRSSSADRCFYTRTLCDLLLSFSWWGWEAFA